MTYPNLIAAHDEECRIRSIRLGVTEKRGRLPYDLGTAVPISDEQIRIRVIAAASKGRKSRTDLVVDLNNSKRCIAMLDKLVAEGFIVETKEWRSRFYELAK
jgi:hypothetical protein